MKEERVGMELFEGIQNGWFDGWSEQDKKNIINWINDIDKNSLRPRKEDIFNAFKLFPMKETRIVIIGQDPYPEEGKADGLAFSVKDKKRKASSLTKIFKAVDKYNKKRNKNHIYNLENWATENRVLLLNSSLTYNRLYPNKKKKNLNKEQLKELVIIQQDNLNFWKPFIIKILDNLFSKNPQICIFLWGEKAQTLFTNCKNNEKVDKQKIYITCHPKKRIKTGEKDLFLEEASESFDKCDKILYKKYKKKAWNSL